jgi:trans-2,3-dihydro-3-hydroxyanthranilate isomerase
MTNAKPTPLFYIVDVFAEQKYAGNPLAVFFNTASLSDQEMQAIAKEMNYSETTFVLSNEPRKGGYNVRIFTPENELPFAGHPTLGTAFAIQHHLIKQPVKQIQLNLKVGPIPVELHYSKESHPEMLWMRQNPPQFGKTVSVESLTKVLQLTPEDFDTRFPIQSVSTGVPFVIVPLKHIDAVKQCQVDLQALKALGNQVDEPCILVFAPQAEEPSHDIHARVFVDIFGIPEDPATGSANGCLAAYLAKHRYYETHHIDKVVEQGYEIGRPSVLYLRSKDDPSSFLVEVGGKCVLTAKGEWL